MSIPVESAIIGVPAYFRKITIQNPDIIFDVSEYPGEIDNLYIDANSMMHPCARDVMSRFIKTSPDSSLTDLENEICAEFLKYLDKVTEIVQPSKLLFIAVDGPAPRAKMEQQRSRRYKSSKMRSLSDNKYESLGLEDHISKFDTNAITPGTNFMKTMMKAIENHYTQLKNRLSYKVIFSSSSVAGEGEHKIMSHIRQNSSSINRQINCIYGLDADLIFLSLSLNFKKMLLFREHIYFAEPVKEASDSESSSDSPKANAHELDAPRFDYLSIDKLRIGIAEDAYARTRCRFDTDKIIRDYVFVCYLLGNDFLPHLPSLSISTGGLDVILKHYYGVLRNSEKHLVLADGNINCIFFKKLLQSLTYEEDRMLREDSQRRRQFQWNPRYKHNPDKSEKENEHDKLMHAHDIVYNKENDGVNYGETGWKWRYWTKYFGCAPIDRPAEYDEIRRDVVREYLTGLKWTKFYYYNDLTDWRWYFPYGSGPTLSDIIEFFVDINDIQIPRNKSVRPLEQMMLVLPSSSQALLPKSYSALMTQSSSSILQYYPIDFQVHAARKRHFGETIPRLPVIEIDKVLSALKGCRLSSNEKECNILDKSNKTLV